MPHVSNWTADNQSVWREKVGDQTISLRHPTYPAEAQWTDENPETLKAIVAEYLSRVEATLGLPDLFEANSAKFKVHMAWLKLPAEGESQDPREASWVTRNRKPIDKKGFIDSTVVFIASESRDADKSETILGSRLGLRVVAHLSGKSRRWDVRITSVARSVGLPQSLTSRGLESQNLHDFYSQIFGPSFFALLKPLIFSLADLRGNAVVAIDGVRAVRAPTPDDRVSVELYATASRPDDNPLSLAYALTARFVFDENGIGELTVEKFPLVANAVSPVKVDLFTRDPASRAGLGCLVDARPSRSQQRLDKYKEKDVELDGISPDGYGKVRLEDDLSLVKVLQSKIVARDADESLTQVVTPGAAKHARTDTFVELSAYEHVRACFDDCHLRPLFDSIIEYGLSPLDYFRFAILPLLVRHRAGIVPGPGKDGKTVNAQVAFDPPECDLVGSSTSWDKTKAKTLEVRFALADVKRSTSRRDPLGLASDPRWSWHEYSHVLLAGRTGRLEFHFAHSTGDALAAIVSDPWSELAVYPWTRGYTFPWVYLHRRHDRSVHEGWSWSGRHHRPNRFVWPDCNCRHKGYESEQILSTSLFRLYLALGGDTRNDHGDPDRSARLRAADYTVYLILRGIRMMPAHNVSVLETPDQLVTTLIDADIATWPVKTGPLKHRVGGWAHKVVRWAFEAQGLYATTNPSDMIDAPGLPPAVDIFIDTRRPDSEGDFPRGGYMPVSLDWLGGALRSWHAHADAIKIVNGKIWVEVHNRGQKTANDVKVAVWYIAWPAAASSPPPWDPAKWTRIDESIPKMVLCWPNPAVSFGPFDVPPRPSGKCLLILAMADCADDLANTHPNTSLPCSIDATPLIDLVAGDNNLGLWII